MVTRAFVTGIGGQDGSYLADRLVDDGLEVHALVLDADPARQDRKSVVEGKSVRGKV